MQRLAPEGEPGQKVNELAHQDIMRVPMEHEGVQEEETQDEAKEPKG